MPDRDRAPADVEAFIRNTQLISAVNDLNGKGFVQLPEINIIHAKTVCFEQLGNRVNRPDTHFIGFKSSDRHTPVYPQRRQAPLFSLPGLHQYRCRGTIRKLRRIARGNKATLVDFHSIRKHRLQRRKGLERRTGPVTFILFKRHLDIGHRAGFPVNRFHDRGERDDLVVKPAFGLCLVSTILRLHGVFVLYLPTDVVACRDDLGRFKHRHIQGRLVGFDPVITGSMTVHVVILNQRYALQTTSHRDRHTVGNNLFGCGRDGHHAGGTLPID